ncbi:glycosyltransferase family 4 protein [Curtobacterium luteum]|nr:glycosyltransferase family 4 protein [Curtobacterium luteum]
MSVVIVAAPLMARSGVYHSTIDLVRTARASGEDWRALIAVRPGAGGARTRQSGVTEVDIAERGAALLSALDELLARHVDPGDTVITMVPQSDIAASRTDIPVRHVAWVRGLPWPGTGEQGRVRSAVLRHLETRALRRADDVWATSPLLADQIRSARDAVIVPAGVPLLDRSDDGSASGPLRWAGRLSVEKGPAEFVEIVRRTGFDATVHGEGPLRESLLRGAPPTIRWEGWADPRSIWSGSGTALCTSHRDAFGRSPVEAASAGLPVVLSDQTGVAPFLFTDRELSDRFVLPVTATDAWVDAVRSLATDAALRRRVSDHVHANAQGLSIEASFHAARKHLT